MIDYFDNIEEDDLIIDQLIKTIFKKCDKNIATRSYGGEIQNKLLWMPLVV